MRNARIAEGHQQQQRDADDRHRENHDRQHEHRNEEQLRQQPREPAEPRVAPDAIGDAMHGARRDDGHQEREQQHEADAHHGAKQPDAVADGMPPFEPHAVEHVKRLEVELRPDSHFVDRPADARALFLFDAAANGRDVAANACLRSQPDAAAHRDDVVVDAAKHRDASADGDDGIGHQLVFTDDDAAADVDLC